MVLSGFERQGVNHNASLTDSTKMASEIINELAFIQCSTETITLIGFGVNWPLLQSVTLMVR
jgi:hypothetical protein